MQWFDIGDVGKGAARFDLKKLLNLNGHYLREANDLRLAALVSERLEGLDPASVALLEAAMPVLKVRAADLNELAAGARFLFAQRPLGLDEKAATLLTHDARALLGSIAQRLEAEEWLAGPLETALKVMAEERGIGLGKLAQPLRAALTGTTTSPGIFDVLVLLGRTESLARIVDQTRIDT